MAPNAASGPDARPVGRSRARGATGTAVFAAVVAVSAWAGALGLATGTLDLGAKLEQRLPFHSPGLGVAPSR